jgi:hypothetical protein
MQPNSWSVPSMHPQVAIARQPLGGQLVWHWPPVVVPPLVAPVELPPPLEPPVVSGLMPPVLVPVALAADDDDVPPEGLVEQAAKAAATTRHENAFIGVFLHPSLETPLS